MHRIGLARAAALAASPGGRPLRRLVLLPAASCAPASIAHPLRYVTEKGSCIAALRSSQRSRFGKERQVARSLATQAGGADGKGDGNGESDDDDDDGSRTVDIDEESEDSVPVENPPDDADDDLFGAVELGEQNTSVVPPIPIPDVVKELLVLGVDRAPIFPYSYRVYVTEDVKLMRKLSALYKSGLPWVGAFLRRDTTATPDNPAVNDLSEVYSTGVFCQITHIHETPAGKDGRKSMRLLLQGVRRVNITGINDDETCLTAQVNQPQDSEYAKDDIRINAYHSEIVATMRDIMHINPSFRENVSSNANHAGLDMQNRSGMADFAASLATSTADGEALQAVLEIMTVEERQLRALELMKHELLQAKLQQQISKEVEDSINARNREHVLREQLKVIKKELGITKDDKDAVGEKFRKRLEGLTVPTEVADVIEDEMNKLGFLDQNSSEFNVTRNYLDWLTALPWGKSTDESLDIDNAQEILDEDHYGMKDVKDRVLEFIAVGKLRGTSQGKILCFVGPPGVGKTSIAKSISRSLNRQYYRFSVGGLHDVAEIKGHRRTYVGAMPGKLIQCLKKAESENPLVCIDEIDKIGRGHTGDPTSALLELLDPEQNANFLDHYLDVPVDLSKVLFVCTANSTDTIPGPLLDRMEVIQLSGYMASEKVAIAEKYIIPTEAENAGIPSGQVTLTTDAMTVLISQYCRESGVRNLQKHIQKLFRKSALKIVRVPDENVVVTPDNLRDYVGNPVFTSDRLYEETPPGVIMGLAWTSMGGSSLYIETVIVPNDKDSDHGGLSVTGQLGDVMKESTQVAYAYAKSLLKKIDPTNNFFAKNSISLHVPEGAIPKDGPSAGITIVSALISLALGKPAQQNLAMTGEISLTGKVLRVGGIKEKILAAKRSGVTKIILPEGCRADFDELDDEVRDDIEILFAKDYQEVYDKIFGR